MKTEHYEEEIQRLCREMAEERAAFDPGVFETLTKLLEIAERKKDRRLIGYACYYLADVHFSFDFDVGKQQQLLARAIRNLKQTGEFALLARAYNLLGIIEFLRGNIALSIDYYMLALECCDRLDSSEEQIKGIVQSNLGRLYVSMRDYETGLMYMRDAAEILDRHPEDPMYWRNLIGVVTFLGGLYLLGEEDTQEAEHCLSRAMELKEQCGEARDPDVEALHIKLCHHQGRLEERDERISDFMDFLKDGSPVTDMIEDFCSFGEFLFTIDKLQECEKLIKWLHGRIQELDLPGIRKSLLELEIEFYKKTGDTEAFHEATVRFYELIRSKEKSEMSAFLFALQIRQELDNLRMQNMQMEEENQKLLIRADYDQLTGLPNRYHLNAYADLAFEYAFEKKQHIAVEMVDVDYFKQYNDLLGHQAGDECLKRISGEIRSLCNAHPGIYAARYGGDEFVLIYENMTDDEIYSYADELRKRVEMLKIEHPALEKGEFVTISQGIRNSIPMEKNRIWDYTFTADSALYQVKRRERGGILLVHRATVEGFA